MKVDYQRVTKTEITKLVEKLMDPALKKVGIDTEFVRVSTYWPKLCLIQLSVFENIYIIDPLELDATPIVEALDLRSDCVKIFHSGRQDIEAFSYLYDIAPKPVFDTQIAATFCGFQDSVSYKELVQKLLNVEIDKSQQFTKWGARPLTQEQLKYAAVDVQYLIPLFDYFTDRLKVMSKWAQKVMDEMIYSWPPAEQYFQTKILRSKLNPQDYATQKAMCIWRENYCRASNKTRGDVLSDNELAALRHGLPFNDFLPNNPNREMLFGIYSATQDTLNTDGCQHKVLKPNQNHLLNRLKKDILNVSDLPLRFVSSKQNLEDFLFDPLKSNPLLEGIVLEKVGKKLLKKYYPIKIKAREK